MGGIGSSRVGPVIPVSDLEASRSFYESKLGLRGEPAPGGWVLYAGGDTRLFLLDVPQYAGRAEWPLASFRTDDLDRTVAERMIAGSRSSRTCASPGSATPTTRFSPSSSCPAGDRNPPPRRESGSAVSELFDDAEPENDSLAEAMDDFDRIETFRMYIRDGIDELQDWLREQAGD